MIKENINRIPQIFLYYITILFPSLISLTLFLNSCSEKMEDVFDNPPDPALGPKPVLWNLGLDFDATFTLDDIGSQELKFFEFGYEVQDGHTGEMKALPHFTYAVSNTTEIISPMKGYVASVNLENEQNQDFAIWLMPLGDTTAWLVEFDHITKLEVKEGDIVDVGDLLGYPTFGVVELMINGPNAHVCPWNVFAPEVLEETQEKLAKFLIAWDSAKWALPEDNYYHPDNPIYTYRTNPSIGMEVPGCLVSEVLYPDR